MFVHLMEFCIILCLESPVLIFFSFLIPSLNNFFCSFFYTFMDSFFYLLKCAEESPFQVIVFTSYTSAPNFLQPCLNNLTMRKKTSFLRSRFSLDLPNMETAIPSHWGLQCFRHGPWLYSYLSQSQTNTLGVENQNREEASFGPWEGRLIPRSSQMWSAKELDLSSSLMSPLPSLGASQVGLVVNNQRTCLPVPIPETKRCRFSPWVGKIPWRRKWQLTLIFLPGEFHGHRHQSKRSGTTSKGHAVQ